MSEVTPMDETAEKVRIARETVQKLKRELASEREKYALREEEATLESAMAIAAKGKHDKGAEAVKRYLEEWRTDLHYLPEEVLHGIRRNPDKAFLSWLERRVGSIYWLSERGRSWVLKAYPEQAKALEEHIWKSELLWAFRQRRPSKEDEWSVDRTWLLAAIWYRSAIADTTTWFKKIVTRHFQRLTEDYSYLQSEPRRMVYHQILGANQLPAWQPLWLDVAMAEIGPKLEGLSPDRLLAARTQVERDHEVQFGREVHDRIAMMFWAMRTAVMPSMVAVAVEMGWSAQTLVDAEREFVQKLLDQRVEILDRGGYGYREFAAFIRANPKFRAKPPLRKVQKEREKEFNRLAERKLDWLMGRMPDDYREAYGESNAKRRQWRESYAESGDYPETEIERYEEAKRIEDLLAGTSSAKERTVDVPADRVEHPLRVHYAWFLVKRKAAERQSLAGGGPSEAPTGQ